MRAANIALSLGIAVPILLVILFFVTAATGKPLHPGFMPWVATPFLLLGVASLVRRRSFLRFLGLGLALVATAVIWMMVLAIRTPGLEGPLRIGEPLPAFTAVQADGSAFSPAELLGPGPTALVFFRGKW